MPRLLDIAGTGLDALLSYPLRSAVTVAAVVTVLLPYLTALGISKGIEAEAEVSARCGADLYVSGEQFGRPVPISLAAAETIRKVEGVHKVVPRIVADVVLGKEHVHAVLVGMPPEDWPPSVVCVEGRLPRPAGRHELVVGTELARRLGLRVGSRVRPFYRNDRGERLSEVVGLFRADVSLWQACVIYTTFDNAAYIGNQPGVASDLLVYCRPGFAERVRPAIHSALRPLAVRIIAREDLAALLSRGVLHLEGIFNLHFLLFFVMGILVVLVTAGFGVRERRREIGILKATGWQTDEVLLRGLVESFLLSLTGAALAVVLAWVWLRWLNGWGIAGLFLTGAGPAPAFPVPWRLTPVPVLLGLVLSFTIIMSGTLYPTWRAAAAAPLEAMR